MVLIIRKTEIQKTLHIFCEKVFFDFVCKFDRIYTNTIIYLICG